MRIPHGARTSTVSLRVLDGRLTHGVRGGCDTLPCPHSLAVHEGNNRVLGPREAIPTVCTQMASGAKAAKCPPSASSAPQDTGTHARGPLVLLFGTFIEGKLRFGLLDSEGYATEAADAWGIADEGCQGCTYWCISSDESKGSVMVWLFSLALYQ